MTTPAPGDGPGALGSGSQGPLQGPAGVAAATMGATDAPEASADRLELILYATPTGPLAEACDAWFAETAAAFGPTTAQTYPPHCTLTGFFRRPPEALDRVIHEVTTAVADDATLPASAVQVVRLHAGPEWVGLELAAPAFVAATQRFADLHVAGPDDDPIRVKDWMHLSLAYGGVDDLAPWIESALERFDPVPLAEAWELALWQRRPDGTWTRHT